METIFTVSIIITEVLTLSVLGVIVFMCLVPLYDWLKKNIKAEKKQKKEDYDWVSIEEVQE